MACPVIVSQWFVVIECVRVFGQDLPQEGGATPPGGHQHRYQGPVLPDTILPTINYKIKFTFPSSSGNNIPNRSGMYKDILKV